MRWGLPRRRRSAAERSGPRRPPPDRQCTEPAASTGLQCSQWAIAGDRYCHSHAKHRTTSTAVVAHRRNQNALTGAVATVRMDGVAWETWRPGSRAWQQEAWRLYDITGPLRFVANWAAHSVSRCRLYIAEVGDDGEPGKETDDPEVAALAGGFLGAGPAKDEALRLLGLHLFVPGESYIVAEADAGPDGADRWFVVSGRRIRRLGDSIVVTRPRLYGGGDLTLRDGVDLLIQVWTPHPDDPDEPDSPVRSAIPDLRELEAIRKREFAELDSRLAGAGILPLPEGIQFPPMPNDDDEDDEPPQQGLDSFTARLMRTMARSLTDRASAEAMVPILLTMPGEFIDKVKLVTFWSELSAQLLPLRESAIKCLAQSLDVPAEVLLGMGDSNHWTAWQISEDAVTTQIVPLLSRIADAGTTGYLRAALETIGRDPNKYACAFDTAPLTTRPNRSADALSYHEAGLLSDEAAVESGAFRPDQMPTVEERNRRLVEKIVLADPTMLADTAIQQILGIRLIGLPAAPAGPAPGPEPAPPVEAEQPRALPAQPQQTDQPPAQDNPAAPAPAAVLAVANLTLLRALRVAGGRLIPHTQRDRWPDTPRHQLHTCHGPVPPPRADEVLRGVWDDLEQAAADLGVDPTQLRDMLHGFCTELLTRGMAYDRALLADLVTAAVRGHRLDRLTAVAA